MTFFSGFCLKDEAGLFKDYLYESDYTVAGFSYGAVLAVEYVDRCTERIDRLQLLSPAFFHGASETFIQNELERFRQDPSRYMKVFLRHVGYPAKVSLENFLDACGEAELERLLRHRWSASQLRGIQERGIIIETFLGGRDRIIDAQTVHDFFKNFGTAFFIKEAGHLLKQDDDKEQA